MKKLVKTLYYFLLIIFPIFLLLIFYSNYSLAGFWTDIYFTLILFTIATIFVLSRNKLAKWFSFAFKLIQLSCLCVCLYFVISPVNSLGFWDRMKTRSFMNITCIDNKYNAYFHPVGAYSGGYGNVSVTKKLSYFPFLEEDITFIHAIHYDLSEDLEDGTKLDHKHILSELIWKQFVLDDEHENKNIKPLNLSEIKSIKIFNSRNSQSSTLSIKQSQEFVNQLNNSINIGMTKSLHEFEITINLISGETRKLSVNGNSIKDWKTNDITYKAKDLSFLKRFEEENSQKNPSKNILRTGNKELKSFEETYEQKWSTKPNIFPYSKYSKIRAFKIECSGECFKAEFRHRKAEGKEVSQKQFDNLMKILKNPDSYGSTTAACFDPGFALVLYDEKNIPSEFMSFCLDCNSFRTYPGEINVKYKNELLYGFSKEARNMLRSFFSTCGVDYQNKSSMFD